LNTYRIILSSFLVFGKVISVDAAGRPSGWTSLWLSETSVYEWRLSPELTDISKRSPRDKRWAAEFLFRRDSHVRSSESIQEVQRQSINRANPFGLMTPYPAQQQAALNIVVMKKLMKVGSERQLLQNLFGPHGSLSVASVGSSLAEPEIVVQGVNDEALAEPSLIDGEAGDHDRNSRLLIEPSTRALNQGVGRQVVDASEGTPLDPLLNTTYDLNYPKVIPSMNDLSKSFFQDSSKRP
jgi:hypothetical protein